MTDVFLEGREETLQMIEYWTKFKGFRKYHEQFDIDEDGLLQADETVAAIAGVCKDFKIHPPTSDKIDELFLKCDKTHNHGLSVDEWERMFNTLVKSVSAQADVPRMPAVDGWDFKDGLFKQVSEVVESPILEKSTEWDHHEGCGQHKIARVDLKPARQDQLQEVGVENAVLVPASEFATKFMDMVQYVEDGKKEFPDGVFDLPDLPHRPYIKLNDEFRDELLALLVDVKQLTCWEHGVPSRDGMVFSWFGSCYHAVLPWGQYVKISMGGRSELAMGWR